MTEDNGRKMKYLWKRKNLLQKREQNIHMWTGESSKGRTGCCKWIVKYYICKVCEVLSSVSVDKGSIWVDKMMLEKANIAYAEALKKLDKIRESRRK